MLIAPTLNKNFIRLSAAQKIGVGQLARHCRVGSYFRFVLRIESTGALRVRPDNVTALLETDFLLATEDVMSEEVPNSTEFGLEAKFLIRSGHINIAFNQTRIYHAPLELFVIEQSVRNRERYKCVVEVRSLDSKP